MIRFPDGVWMVRDTSHFDEEYGRCHDCNAIHGQIHHPGCDVERCPRCHGQMISCDCFGEEPIWVSYARSKYRHPDIIKVHAVLLTMRDHFGKPWADNTHNVTAIRDFLKDGKELPYYMSDCGELIKQVHAGDFPL